MFIAISFKRIASKPIKATRSIVYPNLHRFFKCLKNGLSLDLFEKYLYIKVER